MIKKNTKKYKIQKKQKTLRAKEKRGNTLHRKKTAIERAIEFGVDITLLQQNLKLTPTQRFENFRRWLEFAEHVRRSGQMKRGEHAP